VPSVGKFVVAGITSGSSSSSSSSRTFVFIVAENYYNFFRLTDLQQPLLNSKT
jgi:hypothetical protein